jgi:hypothetical protein
MRYLYETHLHTAQSSACASAFGHEYISVYRDLGYTGLIVTDHFYRGNSRINRSLPWKEWVKRFGEGYESALVEGEKRGLSVFFGWEETFAGDDYLVYGPDRDWLLAHGEAAQWTRKEQFDAIRAAGGCVVQAHPFRQHYWIDEICLSPYGVDAIEIANAGNNMQSYDALAKRYAEKLGLPCTAGSDIHHLERAVKNSSFGVYLNTKMRSIHDYVTAIREKRIAGLKMSAGRCDWHGDESVSLPVDIRDANDRSSGKDLWEFLEKDGV